MKFIDINGLEVQLPDKVIQRYGQPFTRCPPAPEGYKLVNEEPSFLPIRKCFPVIDLETGETKLDCYGDGKPYGNRCTVTCQYEDCHGNSINLEGQCFISPFPYRI